MQNHFPTHPRIGSQVAGAVLLGLLTLASGATNAIAADEGRLFRMKFRPGEAYRVETKSTSRTTAELDGKTFKSTQTMEIDAVSKTLEVDDRGRASVEQRMTRVLVDIQPAGRPRPFHFDSTVAPAPNDRENLQAASLRLFSGITITMQCTDQGEVLRTNLADQVAAAAGNDPGLLQLLTQVFPEDLMEQMGGTGGLTLPAEAIEANGTWTAKRVRLLPQFGAQEAEFIYTYLGPESAEKPKLDRIRIDGTWKLKLPKRRDVDITILNQSLSGEMVFDQEMGRVIRAATTQQVTMKITAGDKETTSNTITEMGLVLSPVEADATAAAPAAGK